MDIWNLSFSTKTENSGNGSTFKTYLNLFWTSTMNIYEESKINLSLDQMDKFGDEAIALSKTWNELMDTLDEQANESSKKQRITVQISSDIIERIKNAVYWTPGMTLTALTEMAYSKIIEELEKKRGESFRQRKENLKSGRPVK